ncbi:ACT domain-containing protein [Motilimonas sp. E26]|uniref:glycine cleavage system protein R n=2 Tax=Alteromonadales genera incertae sedis TaxID=256005 RepID=UPI001E350500|nr:ACT domain-containing protein [Motilimonas sp. E26]
MMNTQFMATIAGEDRPDLLKLLAGKTHALEGRWLDSKISRLEGQIAGIIKIDIPNENLSALKADFNSIPNFHVSTSDVKLVTITECAQLNLKIEANDRPGIISDIAHFLDSKGVAIEHMENHRFGVIGLGTTVFIAELSLMVPVDMGTEFLVEELERLSSDLRVEVEEIA